MAGDYGKHKYPPNRGLRRSFPRPEDEPAYDDYIGNGPSARVRHLCAKECRDAGVSIVISGSNMGGETPVVDSRLQYLNEAGAQPPAMFSGVYM